MRRNYKPRRTRRRQLLAKVETLRPPRPKIADLRVIYKKLVTTDEGQQVQAMIDALHWYDQALLYCAYKKKLKADAVAAAQTSRGMGIAAKTTVAKLEYYRAALEEMQEACYEVFLTPRVDEVLALGALKSTRLLSKEQKLETKFGRLIEMVKQALNPVNVDGIPVEVDIAYVSDPYVMTPERHRLTLRPDYAGKLMNVLREKGLYSFTLDLLDPLSRICSLAPTLDVQNRPTGLYVFNDSDRLRKQVELLRNLERYIETGQVKQKRERENRHAASTSS